jgi:plastocyanin
MLMFWLGRRLAFALAAAGMMMAAAGALFAGRVAAEGAAAATVAIENFAFGPDAIRVKRGTTVTWTNKDDEPHTVVSDGGSLPWKSAALDTDDSFSVTFAEPGTYKYFCSIHPRMQGTVIVE